MNKKWITEPENLSVFNHIHPTEPPMVYMYIKRENSSKAILEDTCKYFINSLEKNLHKKDKSLLLLGGKRGAFVNTELTKPIEIKSNKIEQIKVKLLKNHLQTSKNYSLKHLFV